MILTLYQRFTVKEHWLYWIFPFLYCTVLLLLYFFGLGWMREIVAPAMNREFGLLENSQNILLLLAGFYSFRLLVLPGPVLLKSVYFFMLLVAGCTFLEEIDYGNHFWTYFNTGHQTTYNYNMHNLGNTNSQLRFAFYLLVVCFVMIMPFIRRLPPGIKHFVAPAKLQLTVLVLFVIAGLAATLKKQVGIPEGHSLRGNVSEFEEFCLYYLLFVYLYVMYKRELAAVSQRKIKIESGS